MRAIWKLNTNHFTAAARLAVTLATAACVVSCASSAADISGGAVEESTTSTATPGDEQTAEESTTAELRSAATSIDVVVSAHETNTLIASVEVTTDVEAPVELIVEAVGVTNRVLSSSSSSTTHLFDVVGLRADTTYFFTAASGEALTDPTEFTTGPLPAFAPAVAILQATDTVETDGITFVGVRDVEEGEPAYFGFDSEGEIVWYLETDETVAGDPYLRHIGDGEILVTFRGLVQHVSLSGDVLAEFDLSGVDGFHHDYRLLDDGGLLLLTRDLRTIDGVEIVGDNITELDANGNIVWEWASFDHLDITRFPGDLSTSEARSGGLDWTHANSLWIDEESGQILVSLRSQGWIISIDSESGEIAWIAGDSVGTAAGFAANFLTLESGTWTTGQHAAMLTSGGELLTYDNRNESGGETELSRAVVYELDIEAGTANQVFDASAGKYTASLGDVDELLNSNILISAGGSANGDPDGRITEVSRNGEVVWEAVLADISFYRAERITWAQMAAETTSAPRAATDDPADIDEQAASTAEGTTDITDATLTSTESSCAAYGGSYSSQITDVSRDIPFDGSVTIRVEGDQCIIEANSIPNHDVGEGSSFANEVDEVTASYHFPLNPTLADEPTSIGGDAAAVILLNGVVWESYPAACFDYGEDGRLGQERIGCMGGVDHPWRYNIGSPLNEFGVDVYSAHAQADGYYHYHQTPIALYEPDCDGASESPVIGFAKDGFPVFGPCFTDEDGTVRTAESSYELKEGERQDVDGFTTPYVIGSVASTEYDGQFMGDYEFVLGSGDLDQCNGMTVDGVYGYYLSDSYPYVIACYSGTPTAEADFGRMRNR